MTDFSDNTIENLDRDIKEAEKSVLAAIAGMDRDLQTLIPTQSATGYTTLSNIEPAAGMPSNHCCDGIINRLDNIGVDLSTAVGKLDKLDELSHLSKLDNLSKLGDLAQGEKERKDGWRSLISGKEGLKASFDSFKDAISELADHLLTFADMGKIADKAVDIGQMADMTGTSAHDVQQAIYMGKRFNANENETMLLYKNMANLNTGIASHDMSGVANQDILRHLNEIDSGVLASRNAKTGKEYTVLERIEAIRNALNQMSHSDDVETRALALAYKNQLAHHDKHLFAMLNAANEDQKDVNGQIVYGWNSIKKQSSASSDIATNDKTIATNQKTSDVNARSDIADDASNYKATATASPFIQGEANIERKFIENHEDLVANTKATIAVAKEANDKISLAFTALTAIAGFIGIFINLGKMAFRLSKWGGKGLKKLRDLFKRGGKGGGKGGGGASEQLELPFEESAEGAEDIGKIGKDVEEVGKGAEALGKKAKPGFFTRMWRGSKGLAKKVGRKALKYGAKFGVKLGTRVAEEAVAKATVGAALSETGPLDGLLELGWLGYDVFSTGYDVLYGDDEKPKPKPKSKVPPQKAPSKVVVPPKRPDINDDVTPPALISSNFPNARTMPAEWKTTIGQMPVPVSAQTMMRARQAQALTQTFTANNNQQYHVNIVVQPSSADPMQIAHQVHQKFTQNVSHPIAPQILKV